MAAALWRLHRLRAGRRGRCRSGSADTGGAGASCWRERAASLRLHGRLALWRRNLRCVRPPVLHVFVICNGAKLHLRHPSLGRRRVRCADSLSDAPATKNTHPLRPRCHRERRAPRATPPAVQQRFDRAGPALIPLWPLGKVCHSTRSLSSPCCRLRRCCRHRRGARFSQPAAFKKGSRRFLQGPAAL